MIRYRIKYWFTNLCFNCRYRIARLFHLEIPKPDVFQQKTNELGEFTAQFTSAVNVLNTAMNSLVAINDSVNEKIAEVDDYRETLAKTRGELERVREKNNKVISNFRALLGSDDSSN